MTTDTQTFHRESTAGDVVMREKVGGCSHCLWSKQRSREGITMPISNANAIITVNIAALNQELDTLSALLNKAVLHWANERRIDATTHFTAFYAAWTAHAATAVSAVYTALIVYYREKGNAAEEKRIRGEQLTLLRTNRSLRAAVNKHGNQETIDKSLMEVFLGLWPALQGAIRAERELYAPLLMIYRPGRAA